MSNKTDLEKSIYKHSLTSIQALELVKMRIQAELKGLLEPHTRKILESDVRRCEVIIEQILCLESMQEFYETPLNLFHQR